PRSPPRLLPWSTRPRAASTKSNKKERGGFASPFFSSPPIICYAGLPIRDRDRYRSLPRFPASERSPSPSAECHPADKHGTPPLQILHLQRNDSWGEGP